MTQFQVEHDEGVRVINCSGWLWSSKYRERTEKSGESFLSCIHCGRNTSKRGKSLGVIVSGGGFCIVHPEDYAAAANNVFPKDGGDMGWFPVGSECIKVIPEEFRVANPYDDSIRGVNN